MNTFHKTTRTLTGRLVLAALLTGSLGVLSACGAPPGGAQGGNAAVTAPQTPYAVISNGKVDVEGGVIEVAARRAGIVLDVLVQEGDIVSKGQVLARLEDQDTQLAVNAARAQVTQAETAMNLTNVNLRAAQREQARLQGLADQNYVAKQRVDTAGDTVAQAQATLASQRAAVQSARAELARAQYNQELTYVRAPMDGKIVRRYANPGSGASTLNVSTMFDLEPNIPRIIRAEIVEASIPDVSVGQDAEIVPEADQSKVYVGKVIRIATTFGMRRLKSDGGNEASDERVVEVVLSTPEGAEFLIGQRVLVKFMKPGEQAGIKRTAPATAASVSAGK